MKRSFFTYIALLMVISVFGQVGYKVSSQFITLFPDTTKLFINSDALESCVIQKSLSKEQVSEIKKYRIRTDGYLVSGYNRHCFGNGYCSYLYRDSENNELFVLPTILLSLEKNSSINNILHDYKGIISINKNDSIYIIKCSVETSEDILKLVTSLSEKKGVKWCEPDMLAKICFDENNPLYPQQYNLHNTGQNGGTTGCDINVEPAWNLTKGHPDITVAIIDTGVELDHEDLTGNVLLGYTIGYPNESGEPINANNYSTKNHGTMCTGIVNAKDNTIGIIGVAPNVKVIPVNIVPYLADSSQEGFASYSDIGNAITWASQHADVLSCSWHTGVSNYIQSAFNNAMVNGRDNKGCVVVAAAGNNYQYITNYVAFPARMTDVIAVGSINRYGNVSYFSQRGIGLDIVAPGEDIISTDITGNGTLSNGNYRVWQGTSFSCPQVAGIAALILSIKPNLTQTQVRQSILNGAVDLNDTFTFGHGLANAYSSLLNALNDSISGPILIAGSENYSIDNLPDDFDISWSVNNDLFSISPSRSACSITFNNDSICAETILTATISKNGQLLKTFSKEIYHIGRIVGNSHTYQLISLPGALNVIWSVDNTAFSLSANGSQCAVSLPNSYQEGTLTAAVSKNGQILKTLTKSLLSHSSSLSVSGTQHDYMTLGATYLGHTFNVNAPNAVNGYSSTNIEVNGDCNITLLSDRFKGMNVSFIGTKQPIYVSHNENEVYFHLQSCLDDYIGGIPVDRSNDNRGVNIVDPSYSIVLRAQCEGGYYDFDLNFHVTPMHGVCDETNSTLIIDLEGSTLYVTLSDAEIPIWGGQYQQLPWYLTIVNAATGSIVYTQNVLGMSTSVNVGSLSSGLYIVRGTLNGNVYSAKFFN
ncbi:MAG: S8 family serine peptidase [Prevotella sp.]|nr:S8 family serine peptidase [Prevotella sp.]